MSLQELACRNCGAAIGAEGIDEQLGLARCGHCGSAFTLGSAGPARSGGGAGADPGPSSARRRMDVPLPDGFQVDEGNGRLEIRRRWFRPAAFFLLAFCVFWNGFMIVWHSMALASGAWFMSLFGTIHTLVGIGLAWFTLALFLNTTSIRTGDGQLRIRTAPVPWPGGNKDLSTDGVEQLFCREKTHHSRNGTRRTYEVHAVVGGGRKQKLLSGLHDIDQALYIEQELERFLGLEDRAMPGEVAR